MVILYGIEVSSEAELCGVQRLWDKESAKFRKNFRNYWVSEDRADVGKAHETNARIAPTSIAAIQSPQIGKARMDHPLR